MNSGLKPRKRRASTPAVAHREPSDLIDPELYARWRESCLGALTERIEEDAIFRLAGDLGGKRVLDLGCGDGTYSIAAFQRGAHVTGVDISNAMLDSAQRRAAACGASVDWHQASAESIPYDSGTFDIVLAVTILCFIKNPLQAVQEVSRVMRTRFNGGKMRTWHIGSSSTSEWFRPQSSGFFFATQATGAAMGPGGQQFSPTALMLAQAIVDKCETFDMPLPAAFTAEVQRNLEGNPDDDEEEEE